MKTNYKLVIAWTLFVLVVAEIVHWIIFYNVNAKRTTNYAQFIEAYKNTYPAFMRPLFPIYLTFIEMGAVLLAGILFLRMKNRVYLIPGIICMVLVVWFLFTLM